MDGRHKVVILGTREDTNRLPPPLRGRIFYLPKATTIICGSSNSHTAFIHIQTHTSLPTSPLHRYALALRGHSAPRPSENPGTMSIAKLQYYQGERIKYH